MNCSSGISTTIYKSYYTLAMEDEYVHNNPRDPAEERFEWLEAQVVDISRNMNLLLVALASNLRLLGDDGGSNLEIGSEGKLGDQEYLEKESQKEFEKERWSSSVMNPSQSLFNMESKVDINPY
jgi:hypothetical protein